MASMMWSSNTAGKDRTAEVNLLPERFKLEPGESAENSQLHALKGSVEREGLDVLNLDSDNLIFTENPAYVVEIISPPGFHTLQSYLRSEF